MAFSTLLNHVEGGSLAALAAARVPAKAPTSCTNLRISAGTRSQNVGAGGEVLFGFPHTVMNLSPKVKKLTGGDVEGHDWLAPPIIHRVLCHFL